MRYRMLWMLLSVVLWVSAGSADAQQRRYIPPAAPAVVLLETFDTTKPTNNGYDNAGWTEFGTPDSDYTALVLEGTESWFAAAGTWWAESPTFATATEIWVYFQINFTNAGSAEKIVEFRDTSGVIASIRKQASNGPLEYVHGATTVAGTTGVPANQTRHIWVRHQTGTGSDGQADLYLAASATRPGTPEISVTTGTATVDPDRLRIGWDFNATDARVDRVIVSHGAIGDNP